MKKLALFLVCASLAVGGAYAQKKLVGEVKKSVESMSANTKSLSDALNNIKPALTNAETAKDPEAWYVAGKAGFGLYDKYVAEKTLGKQVDLVAMGESLVTGYNYMMKAMPLDSILETEKDGSPKIDKKTGAKKYKTKYSKDIVNIVGGHHSDFMSAGNDLYDAKKYKKAGEAWGIYCELPRNPVYKKAITLEVPDSVIGQIRFFQAIAKWQDEDLQGAMFAFKEARKNGWKKKDVYDYEMSCAAQAQDEARVVEVAKEAIPLFGQNDSQYVRIVINDMINKQDFNGASAYLDDMLKQEPNNSEYNGLKGVLLEQEKKSDEALAYFKKAVDCDPNNAKANFDYGRQFFNKAIRTMDQNPDLTGQKLLKVLAPIYQEGLPYLEKALQLDPDNTDCKNALKRIYYQLVDDQKLNALE